MNRLLLLFSCFALTNCLLFGVEQRASAFGRLLCGTTPAAGVLVKLVDKDMGMDDTMVSNRTDANGLFYVSGTTTEMGNIDPIIKVYHDCNDGVPCQRKWQWRMPDIYITRGAEVKWMDVGEWNLEIIPRKEERDCLH